jgi:hypothetical protein
VHVVAKETGSGNPQGQPPEEGSYSSGGAGDPVLREHLAPRPGQSFEPGPGLQQLVALLGRMWGGKSRRRRLGLLAVGAILVALVTLFLWSLLLLVAGH